MFGLVCGEVVTASSLASCEVCIESLLGVPSSRYLGLVAKWREVVTVSMF